MQTEARRPEDRLITPGNMQALLGRLRILSLLHNSLTTVIFYSYDFRTEVLPFYYAARRMVPAGVRALGSAMLDAGFPHTRIVLQQWSPNILPTTARLNGRMPNIILISSMSMHFEACKRLLRDVTKVQPAARPLVVVGGPKFFYEPWDAYGSPGDDWWAPDLVVTGEEYVWLSVLEVLLHFHRQNGSIRDAFYRAREAGALNTIPGLLFGNRAIAHGKIEELFSTGPQRLLGNLDELPDPTGGYLLLEPAGQHRQLSMHPMAETEVARHSSVSTIVMTYGCKFRCNYCPIPAYNQYTNRAKSSERIAEEMIRLRQRFGIRIFFGADDNFFNDRSRALEIAETLAKVEINRVPLQNEIVWGTEATVHDTYKLREYLGVFRRAGMGGLWLGIEDMSAILVKKGQSPQKTQDVFKALRTNGIVPNPMMMHFDSQRLVSLNNSQGLLNQIRILAQNGAGSMQILMLSPSPGSHDYENIFNKKLVIQRIGKKEVQPFMTDGNYVIASEHGRPWHKQINLLLAYLAFYNPITCLSKIPPVVKTALEFKNKLDKGRPWQNRLKVSPELFSLKLDLLTAQISIKETDLSELPVISKWESTALQSTQLMSSL